MTYALRETRPSSPNAPPAPIAQPGAHQEPEHTKNGPLAPRPAPRAWTVRGVVGESQTTRLVGWRWLQPRRRGVRRRGGVRARTWSRLRGQPREACRGGGATVSTEGVPSAVDPRAGRVNSSPGPACGSATTVPSKPSPSRPGRTLFGRHNGDVTDRVLYLVGGPPRGRQVLPGADPPGSG